MRERLIRSWWWLVAGWLLCPGCWGAHRDVIGGTRRTALHAARRCTFKECYWGHPYPLRVARNMLARIVSPHRRRR